MQIGRAMSLQSLADRRRRRGYSTGRRRRGPARILALVLAFALVILAAASLVQLRRPTPHLAIRPLLKAASVVPGRAPALPWPKDGEAAVSVSGIGSLGNSGPQRPLPAGSLAKVMSAYVVLKDHPLGPAAPGPRLTVSAADVAEYKADVATGDSVVAVKAGEVLTERQALAALLIPSADNIATMLARWDAGSVPGFVAKMNGAAARLGLTQTHVVEPSGVDPASVSTPGDLIRLGEAALALPSFAALVGQPQVTLPVSGTLPNFNTVLGRSGVFGIKTGSTAAGGSMLFAAHKQVAGRSLTIVGAVLDVQGLHPLKPALDASLRLVDAAGAALHEVTVHPAGERAAVIDVPWLSGSRVLTLPAPVRFVGWAGLPVAAIWSYPAPADRLPAGARVASVTFHLGDQSRAVALTTPTAIPGPSLRWRLLRRYGQH